MDNSFYAWMGQSSTSLLSDSHSPPPQQQQSRPSSSLDDWSKDRSSSAQPQAASPTLDFNDLLNELGVGEQSHLGQLLSSHPSAASPTSSSLYSGHFSPSSNGFYVPAPYNNMPYGSTSWSPPPSVPLSTYSSLNGATTGPSTAASSPPQSQQQQSQSQQQQQPSSNSPPMVIEYVSRLSYCSVGSTIPQSLFDLSQ